MASCTNCGSEIPNEARICPTCSHPVATRMADRPEPSAVVPNEPPLSHAPSGVPDGSRTTDGMAIASLVCGILGITFFPVVLSIVAIVLGKQSRDRIEASQGTLEGLQFARAGLILGIIGVVLGVLAIVFVLLIVGALFSGDLKFG